MGDPLCGRQATCSKRLRGGPVAFDGRLRGVCIGFNRRDPDKQFPSGDAATRRSALGPWGQALLGVAGAQGRADALGTGFARKGGRREGRNGENGGTGSTGGTLERDVRVAGDRLQTGRGRKPGLKGVNGWGQAHHGRRIGIRGAGLGGPVRAPAARSVGTGSSRLLSAGSRSERVGGVGDRL